MKVTKQLNGLAGKYFLQELEYGINKNGNRNIFELSYKISCKNELAEINNLKGKCTALLYINSEIMKIYNGDILFKDGVVDLINYTEEFTSEESKKMNIYVEWFMVEDYEGIEKSSITTNFVVPGLESNIPVVVASLDSENGSERVFITTNVDRNVDFFEYKYNTGNWIKTDKDFYLDKEKSKNFVQVRAKQLDGVEFGYSNVLKF